MADSSLLASILSGQDPLSPQMLQAYQGSQLSNAAIDPAFGHNEGWGGALAKTIAGFRGGGMTQDAVNNVTQARIAGQPELARLLAGQDPYGALGANPDQFSPLARAALLNGATPGSVAEARLKAADAALARLNVSGFTNQQNGVGAPAVGISAPAVRNVAPPASAGPAPSAAGNAAQPSGRYPAISDDIIHGAGDPLQSFAGAAKPAQQQMMQDPKQRAAIIQRYRQQMMQQQQQRMRAASSGGVPSLGATAPPT